MPPGGGQHWILVAPDHGKLRCSQEIWGGMLWDATTSLQVSQGCFLSFFASQVIFLLPNSFFPPLSISSREGSPATGSTGTHAWEGWGGCDGMRRGHEPDAGGMQLGSVGTTMENEAELWSPLSDCAVCAVAECLQHGGVQQPHAGSLVKRGDKAMGVTSPKAAERRQLPPARSCNRRPRCCLRAAGCVSLRED